jgi:hypothetical protein
VPALKGLRDYRLIVEARQSQDQQHNTALWFEIRGQCIARCRRRLADAIRTAIMDTTMPWDDALWDPVRKAQQEE